MIIDTSCLLAGSMPKIATIVKTFRRDFVVAYPAIYRDNGIAKNTIVLRISVFFLWLM